MILCGMMDSTVTDGVILRWPDVMILGRFKRTDRGIGLEIEEAEQRSQEEEEFKILLFPNRLPSVWFSSL
jgi:hypothetical protein